MEILHMNEQMDNQTDRSRFFFFFFFNVSCNFSMTNTMLSEDHLQDSGLLHNKMLMAPSKDILRHALNFRELNGDI